MCGRVLRPTPHRQLHDRALLLALFPRGSSIGFFGAFGRSADLRQLDDALREADVHPKLVPEAVKLASVRFLKEEFGPTPPTDAYRRTASLIGYCIIGANGFAGATSTEAAEAVEERISAALESGDTIDARLILLTLHAKLIQPSVIEHFGIESD